MDRKQFEELIIPLNEKEKLYRDNPKMSLKLYSEGNLSQNKDGVYLFYFDSMAMRKNHGRLLPDSFSSYGTKRLFFSKQTRFSSVPSHRHDCLEMFYVYSGQCVVTINGNRLQLQKNDVCIMDIHVIHEFEPAGENDIVFNCMFSKDYFNLTFMSHLMNSGLVSKFLAESLSENTSHDNYLLFHTAINPLIRELIVNAYCEYFDPTICSEDVLDSYMTLIFIHLARCYQEEKEKECNNNSKVYLGKVLRYIEQNHKTCTLKTTAIKFGFNPQYLSRVLQKETGSSFKELVDHARLQNAALLLSNTNDSIYSISQQCGWSNQKQFYKKFEAAYGIGPRQYRLNHSKNDSFESDI